MRDMKCLRGGLTVVGMLIALSACSAPTEDTGGAGEAPTSTAQVDPLLRAKAVLQPVLVLARVRDAAARDELAAAARAAGIALVEPWDEDPVVRLQVDAKQLDHILATGLVESIVEEPELQIQ